MKDFFKYKGFLVDYERGSDFFSTPHIIVMVLATIAIIVMAICFRNMKTKTMDRYLKVLSIVIPVLEIIKISWETYWDVKFGYGFNKTGLLPLYTCSMFIYTLPLAAWCKGKVKDCAVCWLSTIGIFGGLTNFYYTQMLNDYPLFSYATFMSLNFHFLMVLTGVLIVVTRYKKFEFIDIIWAFVPILVFSILVIPVDYILQADYMLYYHGSGVPIISNVATFFADKGLRWVYTIIVMLVYLIIAGLFVSIYNLIYFLTSLKKKKA